MAAMTVGQALVAGLRARGVDTVFGIPGVHTIELYRGLAGSGMRHVTPRHEGGAAFMADGYARATGRPGVAFVITGPGLTNALTPMGQAREDSIPILVVSAVNPVGTFGLGHGYLHELPDQQAMAAQVAVRSLRIGRAEEIGPALDAAWAVFKGGRPGPVHIEVPRDVMGWPADGPVEGADVGPPDVETATLDAAVARIDGAKRVVIVAGGGAVRAGAQVAALAARIDAPVVQTVNGRGVMFGQALSVPCSPSLNAVRALLAGADCVVAVGTEIGQTDFDMYATGTMPALPGLIRIDIDAGAVAARDCAVGIVGDAADVVARLTARVAGQGGMGQQGPLRRGPLPGRRSGRPCGRRSPVWTPFGTRCRVPLSWGIPRNPSMRATCGMTMTCRAGGSTRPRGLARWDMAYLPRSGLLSGGRTGLSSV